MASMTADTLEYCLMKCLRESLVAPSASDFIKKKFKINNSFLCCEENTKNLFIYF
jgi:hypothetical protein